MDNDNDELITKCEMLQSLYFRIIDLGKLYAEILDSSKDLKHKMQCLAGQVKLEYTAIQDHLDCTDGY